MSPITHILASWVGFEGFLQTRRDKAIVLIAGVAPDLDGVGIVSDFATRVLGLPETDYYHRYHHLVCHGLPAAIVVAIAAAIFGQNRPRVALLAFASFHLHLLCDLLGSRGNALEDLWGIYYFAPLSDAHPLFWSGQWPLVSWQNTAITAALLIITFARAMKSGRTPVSLVSQALDGKIVATLRARTERIATFVDAWSRRH